MCVCVCVCVRERERGEEEDQGGERKGLHVLPLDFMSIELIHIGQNIFPYIFKHCTMSLSRLLCYRYYILKAHFQIDSQLNVT